jgi:hypothetical protein
LIVDELTRESFLAKDACKKLEGEKLELQKSFESLKTNHIALEVQLDNCRMDLPGPTASVGTRTDYSVCPWDYSACDTLHLMAWGARTTVEKYSDRKLYMSCTM